MTYKPTLFDCLRFAAVVFALVLTTQMIAIKVQEARADHLRRELAEASARYSHLQSRIENDEEATQ